MRRGCRGEREALHGLVGHAGLARIPEFPSPRCRWRGERSLRFLVPHVVAEDVPEGGVPAVLGGGRVGVIVQGEDVVPFSIKETDERVLVG